jgi:hypothetical protein
MGTLPCLLLPSREVFRNSLAAMASPAGDFFFALEVARVYRLLHVELLLRHLLGCA